METTLMVLLICFGGLHAIADKTAGQKFIDTVSDEDKGLFMKYHLSLALNKYSHLDKPIDLVEDAKIPEDKCQQFEKMEAPANFHQNLYSWASNDLQLSTTMMVNLVTISVACYSDSGVCYNPDSVGSLCCPF